MPQRRKAPETELTAGQASYVLERLISDRRISRGEVARYLSEMDREITDLEKRLEALRSASGNGKPGRAGARGQAAPRGQGAQRRGRRRRAITAEQRASRQLQGRYLGLIRQIPASRRAQYQKIAKDKGREAAIKEMVTALGK